MLIIRQIILKEVCLKCQGCCRFTRPKSIWVPHLLSKEKKLKEIRFIPNPQESNFFCAFLNTRNNRCKIYSFRPFECWLYPFLINRKGNKVFLAVHLNCPFVRDNLVTPPFKEYAQYLVKLLNSRQGLGILRNNPQIIREYPQTSNITELKIKDAA